MWVPLVRRLLERLERNASLTAALKVSRRGYLADHVEGVEPDDGCKMTLTARLFGDVRAFPDQGPADDGYRRVELHLLENDLAEVPVGAGFVYLGGGDIALSLGIQKLTC